MHDEPMMPTGNLGNDQRRATGLGQPVLVRRAAEITDADWLSARHERHVEAHQYTGAPLTDWPVPQDMRT
jgi:hypothetical protein